MGGIYYRSDGHSCLLTGFVDAGGCITVIGLITCNLDFYLGLSYTSNGTVEGECTVSVEISYAFFSITVHLTAHRTLRKGGSNLQNALRAEGKNRRSLQSADAGLHAVGLSGAARKCNPLEALTNEGHWKECYRERFAEVLH